MNIAVTSTGKDLKSEIDPRFGRTSYFIVVNPETMQFKVIENEQNLNLPQGAGIQAGKNMVDNKIDLVITGNCGPKAFKVLDKSGIKVITGVSGLVIDAVLNYKNGKLKHSQGPNVEGHWV
ncbi:MAG: NifB/NifX family molybdenum-iron cluster-binding protein [Desulfobacterales bacterium]|nr:NifB/NifX family molybdenum-iron cluster-binding protein [Desulfobacterales bacterium]